jgi:hypothetical protein
MKLAVGVIVLAATGTAAADALQPGARAHGRIVLDETTWGRRFPRVTLEVASEVTGVEAGGRFQFHEVVTSVALDPSGSSDAR